MGKFLYAIAVGSNRRHHRHGAPSDVVRAALRKLNKHGLRLRAAGAVVKTTAHGPAGRDFANGAAIVVSRKDPPDLLVLLKRIERDFGRRNGRRWGPRVLDLDIILWSGGMWADDALVIPHPAFRSRAFVLDPLCAVAPDWRDPMTGLTVRQLRFRNRRATPRRD